MDTRTGEIRQIPYGTPLREGEVLLDKDTAEKLLAIDKPLDRLDEYNKMVASRQVRRSEARQAAKRRDRR